MTNRNTPAPINRRVASLLSTLIARLDFLESGDGPSTPGRMWEARALAWLIEEELPEKYSAELDEAERMAEERAAKLRARGY